MTQPSRHQVEVATNALRAEAMEWDEQSSGIGAVEARVTGMELGRIEAGLFQLVVSPYNEVVNQVRGRCGEGKAAMADIAQTLREVADTYDAEDRRSEHRLRNLY
jgi:hypothetical protein